MRAGAAEVLEEAKAEGESNLATAIQVLSATGATASGELVTGDPIGCTCLWWAKYSGSRGPCKHVLATRLLER